MHVREQACLHTQTHVTRRPRTHRHMHTRIRKTTAHTGTRDRRSDPLSSDRVGGQRQAQEVVPGRHRSPVCSWDVTVLRRELGEGECITVSPSHMRGRHFPSCPRIPLPPTPAPPGTPPRHPPLQGPLRVGLPAEGDRGVPASLPLPRARRVQVPDTQPKHQTFLHGKSSAWLSPGPTWMERLSCARCSPGVPHLPPPWVSTPCGRASLWPPLRVWGEVRPRGTLGPGTGCAEGLLPGAQPEAHLLTLGMQGSPGGGRVGAQCPSSSPAPPTQAQAQGCTACSSVYSGRKASDHHLWIPGAQNRPDFDFL